MQKTWQIKPRTKPNLLEQLLENRGISGDKEIEDFLKPDYGKLHDPFLFADMRKAVDRIWQAVASKEKILIYSDYDADAITANAVLYRTLQFLGAETSVYIPDRFTEGYGLNLEAFQKIKNDGVKVVITVDCGTNSTSEAEFCAQNEIDLISTDHHEITGDLPKAFALINPKQPGTAYPYHEITGVGVAFKLACALLAERKHPNFPQNLPLGFEKWLLDLVAIGTVADCHSLLGENRILVKYGLKVLAKTKWIGLKQIMLLSGLAEKAARGELDTYSIGFIIAPRINAAGRIEHASLAFDLLVTEDPAEALRLAEQLESLNSRRQKLTETVMSEARLQLEQIAERKVLLAVGNDWPKGVVGLVAGKLVEEFSRPVLVLERGAEECTGSARSIGNFNLIDALNFSKNFLVRYGGHAAAAGFTLKNEHVDVFYKQLLDYAENNISTEDTGKILEVDVEIVPEEISLENLESIESFEPFGVENNHPKFMLRGAELQNFNPVGKDQKHLQMTIVLRPEVATGAFSTATKFVKCIAFNFGKAAQSLVPGQKFDLVFEFLADTWNGTKNLKLRIVDFRKAENA